MKLTLEILYEKIHGMKKALKLQAREYKRRLMDLNGEAKRLRDIQAEYIPREVFDRTVQSLITRIEVLENYKTKQDGKSQLLQYIPWVIAIVAIIANYLKK
jgi:DNA repair exonuclease SbcCD ATPase subunit